MENRYVTGAIDGKNIKMEFPKLTDSQNFNYKGFFSMVVLGIYDANYCFVLFSLDRYGSFLGKLFSQCHPTYYLSV